MREVGMGVEMQMLEALANHPRRERVGEIRLGAARYNALVTELDAANADHATREWPRPHGRPVKVTVDWDGEPDGIELVEDKA